MIQRVVILGGHIQALGLARQIMCRGIEVVLLVKDWCSIARFSKSVKRTIVCATDEEVKAKIQELKLPNRGAMIFPTDDVAVSLIQEEYENYKNDYILGVPDRPTIAIFNDKRKAYLCAQANGLPCPAGWYPDSYEDVLKICKDLPYPVVIKPAVMHSFHDTFGKKAFRCNNEDELMATYRSISVKKYPLDKLIIQEYIGGGTKNLYSCGVAAANGQILASIQANRIRQNPMEFGNSTTYAVTCDIPQIQEQTEQLLRAVKYTGLGEIEWMFDEKSNSYKFLEINTRAWKWHTITNKLGFSFIDIMISFYNGELVSDIAHCIEHVAWVERLTDFAVTMKGMIGGKIRLMEVIKSYRIKHESAVWSWDDLLPGIMYIVLSPILYLKRF